MKYLKRTELVEPVYWGKDYRGREYTHMFEVLHPIYSSGFEVGSTVYGRVNPEWRDHPDSTAERWLIMEDGWYCRDNWVRVIEIR